MRKEWGLALLLVTTAAAPAAAGSWRTDPGRQGCLAACDYWGGSSIFRFGKWPSCRGQAEWGPYGYGINIRAWHHGYPHGHHHGHHYGYICRVETGPGAYQYLRRYACKCV